IENIAREISGLQLDGFFDALIRGTDDPPLETLLPAFGVECVLQSAHEADVSRPEVHLGLSLRKGQNRTTIAHVLEDSPAQKAGLAPGDELVAMNDLRVSDEDLAVHLKAATPGQTVGMVAFRRDELMCFDVTLGKAPRDTWVIKPAEGLSYPFRDRWNAWLWRADRKPNVLPFAKERLA